MAFNSRPPDAFGPCCGGCPKGYTVEVCTLWKWTLLWIAAGLGHTEVCCLCVSVTPAVSGKASKVAGQRVSETGHAHQRLAWEESVDASDS